MAPLLLSILTLSLCGRFLYCWLSASPGPRYILLVLIATSPAQALHLQDLFAKIKEKKGGEKINFFELKFLFFWEYTP